jgi:hypothetical protein
MISMRLLGELSSFAGRLGVSPAQAEDKVPVFFKTRPGRLLRNSSVLGIALTFLFAAPAFAHHEYPAVGGVGDASVKIQCPAGQYLGGFSGRTGVWINQIRAMCAEPGKDPVVFGPALGGSGGGSGLAYCGGGQVMTNSVYLTMTTHIRQVAAIQFSCRNARTGETFDPQFFGNRNYLASCGGSAISVGDCDPAELSTPTQACTYAGEVPVGFNLRYGKDVNAFGLICGRVDVAVTTPVRSNLPIRTTGVVATTPPIRTTGTAATATNSPATPKPVTPSLFLGNWQVTAGDGTQFALNLREKTDGVTTALLGSIHAQSSPAGTLRGSPSKTNQSLAHVTFAMSASKGELDLELAPDGQSFSGTGHLADGTAITWKGARVQAKAPQ